MSLVPSPLDNLLAEYGNVKLEARTQRERAERSEAAYEEVRGLLADMHKELDALRALLVEARSHVPDDIGWSYEERTGYLADRIDAALREGGK